MRHDTCMVNSKRQQQWLGPCVTLWPMILILLILAVVEASQTPSAPPVSTKTTSTTTTAPHATPPTTTTPRNDDTTTKKRMIRPLVLGVDGGTESLRVACFDARTGHIVGTPTSVPYPTHHPHPGWAEQDPHDWYRSLCQAVHETLQTVVVEQAQQQQQANPDEEEWQIVALCMDTTCCSVVALNAQYQPLRPALLWMDQRSAAQTKYMATVAAGHPTLSLNGGTHCPTISAEWMIPKALWLHQHEYEETWQRAQHIGEYQDYLNYQLTNRWVASACNAAVRWHWDARRAVVQTDNNDTNEDKNKDETNHNNHHHEMDPYPGRPLSLYRQLGISDLAKKLPQTCLAMGQTVGKLTERAARDLGFFNTATNTTLLCPTIDDLPIVIQGGPDAFVGMIGLGCLGSLLGSSNNDTTTTTSSTSTTTTTPSRIWGKSRQSPQIPKDSTSSSASPSPQLCLITGSSHLHCLIVPARPYPAVVRGGRGMWGPYQDAPLPGIAFAEGGQSSTGSLLKWAHSKLFAPSAVRQPPQPQPEDDKDDTNNSPTPTTSALSYAELDAWAATIPPGSNGLVALETFQGSRTPVTDPLARGALLGWTLSHTQGHVWRALMEGVCFGTRACLEALEEAAAASAADDDDNDSSTSTTTKPIPRCSEIILAGGIANSPLWLQLHADITNRPIRVFGPQHNAPLLGCAMLASVGVGLHASWHDAVQAMLPPSTVIYPNPETAAIYDRIYKKVYQNVASTVRPLVHAIHTHILSSNTPQEELDWNSNREPDTVGPASNQVGSVSLKMESSTRDETISTTTETDKEEESAPNDNDSKDDDDNESMVVDPIWKDVTISPSLLACDFGSMQREIHRCLDAGASRLHVDVFDGVALKSPDAFTFGPAMVQTIAKTLLNRKPTEASTQQEQQQPSMDLHMCVHQPERFVESMAEATRGVPCRFIFQWEGLPKWGRLHKALFLAKCLIDNHMECGVSLNPQTAVEEIYPLLQSGLLSVVDVLAVEPGFGGQVFQSHVLSKVQTLGTWKQQGLVDNSLDIMVDGGVNAQTARRMVDAGANLLVSGSYLFAHEHGIGRAIQELQTT